MPRPEIVDSDENMEPNSPELEELVSFCETIKNMIVILILTTFDSLMLCLTLYLAGFEKFSAMLFSSDYKNYYDGLAKRNGWLSKNFVPQGVVVSQG